MAVNEVVLGTVDSLQQAILSVWYSFLDVVPGLLGALIVVLVGYVVGMVLERVASTLLRFGKIDEWIEHRNLEGAIGKVKLSVIFGALIKWYVFILFLSQALILVNLAVLSYFARVLIDYVPIVSASIVFVLLGLLTARYVANKILLSDHKYKKSVATILEIVIAYMAVVVGLETIGFSVTILMDAFRIGFSVFVVIAAIALGVYFAVAYKREIIQFAHGLKTGK